MYPEMDKKGTDIPILSFPLKQNPAGGSRLDDLSARFTPFSIGTHM